MVSWEPVMSEKFGFQDANLQKKQDLLVCYLWETF